MMTYYMGGKQSFFLGISVLAFLSGYFSLYYFYRPVHVKMPNLVGLSLSNALSLVTSIGCSLSDYGEVISEQYEFPIIIGQDPLSFSQIKVGQTVFVKIGKPESPKTVPSFLGKTESEIQELAEKNSLYVHIKLVLYQGQSGICCGQFPQADSLLSDQCIIVYVSKTAESRFVMPLLINKKYRDVELFLMQHSMVLRSHKIIRQGNYPEDTIVNQIPCFGELVYTKNGFVVDVQVTGE